MLQKAHKVNPSHTTPSTANKKKKKKKEAFSKGDQSYKQQLKGKLQRAP